MPTDGSGNYSKPDNTTAVSGTTVASAPYNTLADDMAAALTARLMANGSKAATANIPMGGNKITGLGAATTSGDAVRKDEWDVLASDTAAGRVEYADNTEIDAETATDRGLNVAGALRFVRNQLASAANIWAGTANKFVGSENLAAAGAWVTLTDAATIATDCAMGRNFKVKIDDSRNMGAPSNVKVGMVYTYEIEQGTGGSRTITWDAVFKAGDGTRTLSTSEGDKDIISYLAVASDRFAFLGIRRAIQ